MGLHACVLSCFSHVWLFVTLWTVAHRAPLSIGILQARILEWVAIPSSRGSSRPSNRICISCDSCVAGELSTAKPPGKPMVFPTFFNLSLNFAIRSSWSEPQSALVMFLLIVYSFSIFNCKEYNQSDFGIDFLVMSICRVTSWVVEKGCMLWPVCSLDNTINLCPALCWTPRSSLPVT